MSFRRSKLFNYLRVCFFVNAFLFLCLFVWWIYLYRQRSRLLDVVERQFTHNIKLAADLAFANDLLTNRVFSAASSFVSNFAFSVSRPSSAFSSPAPNVLNSPSPDLPPVTFTGYFSIDGIPYIRVRNTSFRQGDLLLGYPIQAISPDVVLYRDKFFKVAEEVKP